MKFLVLLLLSLGALAADGKIVFLKGDLLINGKTATKKTAINFGDKVKTGKSSLTIISINPGAILKIKSNSEVIISKPENNKKVSTFSYLLNKGEIFVKAQRTKKNRYNVKTKSASMGVRGTQFFVSTGNKSNSKDWMCVNEGQVEVVVGKLKGSVLVNAGEGVAIDGSSLPEVKKYKWTKELNWKTNGNFEDINDETDIQNINYDLQNIIYE